MQNFITLWKFCVEYEENLIKLQLNSGVRFVEILSKTYLNFDVSAKKN